MASLYKEKTRIGVEVYVIRFTLAGCRKKIQLGAVPKKLAETVKSKVEELVNCKLANASYSQETAQWLSGIDDKLHEKLSASGLVDARNTKTLAAFLKAYKSERIDAKQSTVRAWNTSIKLLVGFLGDVPLRTISNEQAALYRVHLVKQGYATAYVAKSIMIARMFFGVAHRRKLIDDNPFRYVETGSQVNKAREHYVTQEETDHLINACSNAKDRLKIALGRYAGLRIPSELVGLRWSEVNWETGRFIVHSPRPNTKAKTNALFQFL